MGRGVFSGSPRAPLRSTLHPAPSRFLCQLAGPGGATPHSFRGRPRCPAGALRVPMSFGMPPEPALRWCGAACRCFRTDRLRRRWHACRRNSLAVYRQQNRIGKLDRLFDAWRAAPLRSGCLDNKAVAADDGLPALGDGGGTAVNSDYFGTLRPIGLPCPEGSLYACVDRRCFLVEDRFALRPRYGTLCGSYDAAAPTDAGPLPAFHDGRLLWRAAGGSR